MRLLHTSRLILETPTDTDVQPYAILSHRWLADHKELSFQDLQRTQVPPEESPHGDHAGAAFPPSVQGKEGFKKFQGACDRASLDGLDYIWIDTCCIDKTSSAELSEAINSMYAWYRDSAVCYVYLHDVGTEEDPQSGFEDTDWFQRGWTLQELIAPDNVYFFNKNWIMIGSKATFAHILSEITYIRQDVLLGNPYVPSIAEKMSWAAGRKTQKIEDRAYSLMGLFGIHMPIIYGEGEKAFRRLQLEIMKSSDDQTIFAWHDSLEYHDSVRNRGLLASAPDVFPRASPAVTMEYSHFINILHRTSGSHSLFRDLPRSYSILNDGIHITLPMREVGDGWLAILRCKREGQEFPCGIYLKERPGCDGFLRTLPTKLQALKPADLKGLVPYKRRIVIDHHILPIINRRPFFTFQSKGPVSEHRGYYICPKPGGHDVGQRVDHQVLNPDTRIELSDDVRCACIYSQDSRGNVIVLLIGIEHHRPWVHLLIDVDDDLHQYVDTTRLRRQTFDDAPQPQRPHISAPTSTQSSNQADPLAPSSPTSPRSPSSPLSLFTSFTSAGTNQYRPRPERHSTAPPLTQPHRGGTGCPVCSIIENHPKKNIIKNRRVDCGYGTMSGNKIEVNIRKGQVRPVSEAMLGVEYVITVAVSPLALLI